MWPGRILQYTWSVKDRIMSGMKVGRVRAFVGVVRERGEGMGWDGME